MSRVSISFKENAVNAMNSTGVTRLGRVQNAEIRTNLPNTQILELGSNRAVGRIFDIPEVSMTVNMIDVGSRSSFYLANRNWSSASPTDFVTLQDFGYVCLTQPFKSAATDDVARTLVVPAAKIDSIALNYSVNGDATEEFSFVGTDRFLLRYDAVLVSGVTSGGTLTWSGAARQLSNGRYFMALYGLNGYLPNEVATASTATSITFDTSRVPNGTQVWAVIHRDETDAWDYTYELVPTSLPVGVRGWGVDIWLRRTGDDRRVLRAQTCTINANFNSQAINELGSESRVGYMDTLPDVTGTLEIMQHDFRLVELMSGDNDNNDDDLTAFQLTGGGWNMEIHVWPRNADRSVPANRLKTIYIPDIEITDETFSSQVNQDASYSLSWSSRLGEMYIYRNRRP